jgi:hypothetical protein
MDLTRALHESISRICDIPLDDRRGHAPRRWHLETAIERHYDLSDEFFQTWLASPLLHA